MLSHINVVVLGGDDRYLHLMKRTLEHNANITAVGYPQDVTKEQHIKSALITDVDFENVDAILLPVEGMDQQGKIKSHYNDEEIYLTKEMLAKTPKTCIIYTGTANQTLRALAKESARPLVVLFERDDIAIANSVPTAEATLQIAMEETLKTVHDSEILIIGYGRIGKTIARLFYQVGAKVTVAARKDGDIARIREMTHKATDMHHLSNALATSDIIINTVPAPILQKEELSIIQANSLIIDVASKPGGTDFQTAEDLGLHAIHALGLPGKVAPTTAGNIIANVFITLLQRMSASD